MRQHTAHTCTCTCTCTCACAAAAVCRLEAAHGSARFRSIDAVRESSLEPLADITQDDSACVWSKQWGRRHRRRPAQAAEAVVGRAIVRPPPLGMARHLYRPIARPDCPGLLVSLPVCLRRRRLGGAELGHCQGGGVTFGHAIARVGSGEQSMPCSASYLVGKFVNLLIRLAQAYDQGQWSRSRSGS